MAGAANKTAGSITTHEINQAVVQFRKNRPLPRSGHLAIPAAMKLVSPDWMTPKTKWLYRLGIRSIAKRPSFPKAASVGGLYRKNFFKHIQLARHLRPKIGNGPSLL